MGEPVTLFSLRPPAGGARNHYVASPDGQRFLVNNVAADAATAIVGILNWPQAVESGGAGGR